MPAQSPFTRLCQAATAPSLADRADLHIHSTASDGRYSPAQVVELARRTGLTAIALTDHDTLAGVQPAVTAAAAKLEVIPAVEISCSHQDREIHLLAYFVRPDDAALIRALDWLQDQRRHRYQEMVGKLQRLGVTLPEPAPRGHAIGRRHLAYSLVQAGAVGSVREAFYRYLDDGGPAEVPKQRLDLIEAIGLVRAAGGVTSYAHPLPRVGREELARLADTGLQAVETEYPSLRSARSAQLRQWAKELDLAITGGSDCHGPDEPKRAIGAATIGRAELDELRRRQLH